MCRCAVAPGDAVTGQTLKDVPSGLRGPGDTVGELALLSVNPTSGKSMMLPVAVLDVAPA